MTLKEENEAMNDEVETEMIREDMKDTDFYSIALLTSNLKTPNFTESRTEINYNLKTLLYDANNYAVDAELFD